MGTRQECAAAAAVAAGAVAECARLVVREPADYGEVDRETVRAAPALAAARSRGLLSRA